ncbi:hypothetical protein IC619_008270 [Hazenella sp. IB182353]|nr:hypothetical protein [Polycladospora coralii]MBS7530483.1 hypothetical protein [Polycladospora coralii]
MNPKKVLSESIMMIRNTMIFFDFGEGSVPHFYLQIELTVGKASKI